VARGGQQILRGVDLAVAPGTWTALVGRNGAGKSTLLRVLKGIERPDAGGVYLGSGPLEGPDPRIGLVLDSPEDQGVAPVVEDDIAFGLELQGLPPAEIGRRVGEVLGRLDIAGLRKRPAHTLSGGQAQKVALAAVLVLGARFLLLDESLAHLSPPERDRVLLDLEGLRSGGLGLVLATHRADEVLWADRVVWLEQGRVRFLGAPEELFALPECPWAGYGERCRRAGVPPGGAAFRAWAVMGQGL